MENEAISSLGGNAPFTLYFQKLIENDVMI